MSLINISTSDILSCNLRHFLEHALKPGTLNERTNRKKIPILRQSSLGVFPTYPCNGGQIERLGSPKLQKQSYSTEKYPEPSSAIRPSASMGSIPSNKQRFQSRGGLTAMHSSHSLLIEEPELENNISDNLITSKLHKF